VYLAIEKINMLRNTPAGTNEGIFLQGSMSRLIAREDSLAEKLKVVRANLEDDVPGAVASAGVAGGAPSAVQDPKGREQRMQKLVGALSGAGLQDNELDQLFPTFRVHAYYDTGERVTGSDGQRHPVLRPQSSFGIYAYHEGGLDGWQTSLQGAQRIDDNLYLLPVPNHGTAKITVRIQGVSPGEQRIPEDPIRRTPTGCLGFLFAFFKRLFG
jgi:hypothetical protein